MTTKINKLNFHQLIKKVKDGLLIDNLIIGQFEFIHKGHLHLFSNLDKFSFLTFKNNPSKNAYFFDFDNRINNLEKFNPEYIFIFDILEHNMNALEFINTYLKEINPKNIIVGSDFHFGKDKIGDINLLSKYFNVHIIERDIRYSSHNILEMLENGKLDNALELLAIPIYFDGIVVKNSQVGRQLGYPTANLVLDNKCKMLHGSYASIVIYDNKEYMGLSFLGNSKTLNSSKLFFETYIFDFDEEIYGENIIVYPKTFIRKSDKFNSRDALIASIKADEQFAKNFFKTYKK
ncbi:MAG: riboflavin biosynthesis protein RibF [Malacoplasma sp.]